MAQETTYPPVQRQVQQVNPIKVAGACLAGAFIPGLGHAFLQKWDRAIVFLGCVGAMFALGLHLHARLFNPDFADFFAALKFIADAGNGLLYWVCWLRGLGVGEPTAYTYDFGNLFVFGAGLLNMLIVVDAFDIAVGRKR